MVSAWLLRLPLVVGPRRPRTTLRAGWVQKNENSMPRKAALAQGTAHARPGHGEREGCLWDVRVEWWPRPGSGCASPGQLCAASSERGGGHGEGSEFQD